MQRIELWAVAVSAAAAVAVFDLVTGWTANGSWQAIAVVAGLLLLAPVLYFAMLFAGRRDRRHVVTTATEPMTVLKGAARGMRWSGLFAVSMSILFFANCGSGLTTGQDLHVTAASQDAATYVAMTALLLGPLVLALVVASTLTTAAQLNAASRPATARTLGNLAIWASGLAALVAFLTVGVGFFFGVSACDFGTSAGACSAGAGSVMNLLSISSLGLFLPYAILAVRALARLEYERSQLAS